MSIVTITLNNRNFKLFSPEENHAALSSLAEKLDLELSRVKQSNPSASFDLTLVMLALQLLDNREKKRNLEGGEVLEAAQKDFQTVLSSLFDELKIVAKNCE